MATDKLFEPLRIGALTVRNRICVPPMVSDWTERSGEATPGHVAHYRAIAAGGPGLIIQEATCVSEDGLLCAGELGLWHDRFIPGLRAVTDAVHALDRPILVQLHHAGAISVGADRFAPSACELRPGRPARAMTPAEFERVAGDFVDAAERAHRAGYDGVELHGCHSYLLSQILNAGVNRREDRYGREPARYVCDIVRRLRERLPSGFVVGVRLGAFEPSLEDGLRHARALEEAGVDFLNISYGCVGEHKPGAPRLRPPADFPFRGIVWAAGEFKRHCRVPVFAVNGIRTPEDAGQVLALTGVDMVNIGRGTLVDPDWPAKAARGEAPGLCLDCEACRWRINPADCPGRRRLCNA